MTLFAKRMTTATAAVALMAGSAFAQDNDANETLPSELERPTINKMIVDNELGDDFTMFREAAAAAGLSNLIEVEAGDVTLFVPTDEAFAKLPEGVRADLMDPENVDLLRSVVNYHLVAGEHPAAELAEVTELDTLHGNKLGIRTENGMTTLDEESHIVKADIEAENGIIHIVDTVFIPN